ncbi:redoxin family protein [Parapedobacter sp.]
MKILSIKVLPICLVVFGFCKAAPGHPIEETLRGQVTISFRSASTEVKVVTLYCPNLTEAYVHEKTDWFWTIQVPLNEGHGSVTLDLDEPVFMRIRAANLQNHNLFISPGDRLDITLSETKNGPVVVTGKGAQNNQFFETTTWFNTEVYETDTLPDRILQDLRSQSRKDSLTLESYIRQNNPTEAFIDAQRTNQRYFVLKEFHRFAGNHKYALRNKPSGKDLIKQWNEVTDRLIAENNIDNAEALIAPNYTDFIRDFLLRKKETLWTLRQENFEELARDWYGGDQMLALERFNDDPENLLTEKIINRYLSGEVAAFAYAHLINDALGSNEDNLVAIYENFESAYPASTYLPLLGPSIAEIREKNARTLNDRMVFIDENGSLETFEQVLAHVKGKTLLLDMWGTWCGPCREEIERNGEALKAYFKDKGVDFLYVANYDIQQPEKWKQLIAYYGLEGMHILASQKLTEDIMEKTGGSGYPTYIIIKADGTYELSQAGYPMNRAKLIEQIESAL